MMIHSYEFSHHPNVSNEPVDIVGLVPSVASSKEATTYLGFHGTQGYIQWREERKEKKRKTYPSSLIPVP